MGLFKKKVRPYSFKEDPYEPDIFRIYKNNNWFMVIHMNGEMLLERQIMHIEYMVNMLNKNYKG